MANLSVTSRSERVGQGLQRHETGRQRVLLEMTLVALTGTRSCRLAGLVTSLAGAIGSNQHLPLQPARLW